MSTATLIQDLLDEYQSRLGLDGSSQVLVQGDDVYGVVERWCKESYTSYTPTITLSDEAVPSDRWPYKEDSFTHIFAVVRDASKDSLQYLKWIQWSLKYKGIAVLTLANDFSLNHAATIDFIERASFERGRIRVLDRKVGNETSKIIIAMKWDLLSA